MMFFGEDGEADLITPHLYSPLYLLIVEGEGLVTSCLSLSLASLSLSPTQTEWLQRRSHRR